MAKKQLNVVVNQSVNIVVLKEIRIATAVNER